MNSVLRFTWRIALICIALASAPSAFAGAGWYLLIPPISDFDEHAPYLQGFKILDAKPLSQWAQQGAYDSASECEAVKNSLLMTEHNFYAKSSADYIKAVGANKDSAVLKHMRWTTERSNANVDAWMASRCIKSDDPRLGK
jgi:hypothetical protein